eukprot:198917-Prymnesium_polylepis.1
MLSQPAHRRSALTDCTNTADVTRAVWGVRFRRRGLLHRCGQAGGVHSVSGGGASLLLPCCGIARVCASCEVGAPCPTPGMSAASGHARVT